MHRHDDPFGAPQGGSPFGAPPPLPGSGYGAPSYGSPAGFGAPPPGGPYSPAQKPPINTFALLSPIFGVVIPPAGVAFGHLALPQIRRTGERGRGAAIAGLAIGYLMCVVLVALLVWWLVGGADSTSTSTTSSTLTTATTPKHTSTPRQTTVTSVVPPVQPQRIKMDLATVPMGTCVEIQRRSTESDYALDLYKVDCEHRTGVYTVSNRVSQPSQCQSVYTAAPPDESLAVCLNPY